MTNAIPAHLLSNCQHGVCRSHECRDAVKLDPASGNWFITMGHPGFNSRANNREGYAQPNFARAAIRRYAASKGMR